MPPEGTNGGSTEIIPAPLSSLSGDLAHDMVADVTPVRTSVSVSFSKAYVTCPITMWCPMLVVVWGGIKYYAHVRLYYCMYFPSLQRPVCRLRLNLKSIWVFLSCISIVLHQTLQPFMHFPEDFWHRKSRLSCKYAFRGMWSIVRLIHERNMNTMRR